MVQGLAARRLKSLARRRVTGPRPPKLLAVQRRRLVRLLLKGSIAHGYRTNLWTTARIAEVIEREFGVTYHRDHVGRLMHSLIPNVVKTRAPRGRTPVHRHRHRRDKISVTSGISVSPNRLHLSLHYQLWFNNIGHEEVCPFLRHLLRHLRGPVIALWDNSQTHKGSPLEQLQRQHPRLRIEHFPSYAPELNPDEGVWSLAKRDLANGRPDNLDELVEDLIRSIEAIRRSPVELRGCILQSELPPFLR